MSKRLDRVLSNLKYGTRKTIQKDIKEGLISVNDNVVLDPRFKVVETDIIKVDNEEVFYKDLIILMMNKPSGYLSANKDSKYPVVIDLLKEPYIRYDFSICGRLDLDTKGLLILTNSGKVNHEITSPNKKVNKVYLVKLEQDIDEKTLNRLLEPHILKDGKGQQYISKAEAVEIIDSKNVKITISEGKYHQIKNMVKAIGNEVVELKRVQIGKLTLPIELQEGSYKEIELEDII